MVKAWVKAWVKDKVKDVFRKAPDGATVKVWVKAVQNVYREPLKNASQVV